MPVEESIQLAADLLYSSPEVTSVDCETFVEMMRLAVTDVQFMCGGQYYVQFDGVAMGSSLVVILLKLLKILSMLKIIILCTSLYIFFKG